MTELYIFDTNEYSTVVKNEVRQITFSIDGAELMVIPSLNEGIFEIGRRSTFSGLYFNESVCETQISTLINTMLDWGSKSCKGYKIRVPPEYLEPNLYPCLESIFLKKGAKISIEKNQHLPITNQNFLFHFSETNKKIVRRSIARGYVVNTYSKVSKDGYNLLKRNRELRGINLSLSFEEIEHQSKYMKDKYIFFECKDAQETIVAYAVCVNIRSDILHVLYWGEEPEQRKNSPVVYLAKCIIDHCIERKISFLDSGISSLHGILDQGLFEFKSRLGFASSFKYVIEGSYA
jgi:hypothetical protein